MGEWQEAGSAGSRLPPWPLPFREAGVAWGGALEPQPISRLGSSLAATQPSPFPASHHPLFSVRLPRVLGGPPETGFNPLLAPGPQFGTQWCIASATDCGPSGAEQVPFPECLPFSGWAAPVRSRIGAPCAEGGRCSGGGGLSVSRDGKREEGQFETSPASNGGHWQSFGRGGQGRQASRSSGCCKFPPHCLPRVSATPRPAGAE